MRNDAEIGTDPQNEQTPVREHSQQGHAASKHAKGLLAIGLFKLSKAAFFLALGLGALHMIHKDIGDEAMRLATALHFDPEGQFVSMLQDKLDLVSGHQLRQAGGLSILYSGVSLVEGIGLMLEKTWAEYLTLTLTTCALPWELYEIVRRASWPRYALLAINLVVLSYLIWYVKRQRRLKAESCGA